jgi:2'-5' RNA ligase
MEGCSSEGLNSFAVVAYLPEPLAEFVDGLRRELVPDCRLRAHITILPPRPPECGKETGLAELKQVLRSVAPFTVELQEVQVFPVSQVVYISIGDGHQQLEDLHSRLDHGHFKFCEPWLYRPHVTVAQELDASRVTATLDLASRRWREFTGPRRFSVDHLTFVQNVGQNRWADLAECDLRPPVLV